MFNILEEIGIGSANEGERMEITNAQSESFTDVVEEQPYLVILGKDSNAFRAKQHEIGLKMIENRKDDNEETLEEINDRTVNLLSACIIGWGNISNDDMPLDFNLDNVMHLLQNSPSLSDQVNIFVGNRENFLKK